MGRKPCCGKEGVNKGGWSAMEDKLLLDCVNLHGQGQWRRIPEVAGLNRCGKSCRLRWVNYLNPDIKRGDITEDEKDLIIKLHKLLGNRWSLIAGRLPGRTDNGIKNYWNTHLRKKKKDIDTCKTKKAGSSDAVIRTKATKCCTKVFPMHPPPPPLPLPPPPFVPPLVDLPEMEYLNMSFSELFDSLDLTSLEATSDVTCWPAINNQEAVNGDHSNTAAVDLVGSVHDGVSSEENIVSMLEAWLQV